MGWLNSIVLCVQRDYSSDKQLSASASIDSKKKRQRVDGGRWRDKCVEANVGMCILDSTRGLMKIREMMEYEIQKS